MGDRSLDSNIPALPAQGTGGCRLPRSLPVSPLPWLWFQADEWESEELEGWAGPCWGREGTEPKLAGFNGFPRRRETCVERHCLAGAG